MKKRRRMSSNSINSSDDEPVYDPVEGPADRGALQLAAAGGGAAVAADGPEPSFHGDDVGSFPPVHKVVSSLPVDHFGTSVYVKGWRPETPPPPRHHPILIVHDLGEHAGLYREAALTFVAHGFAAYGFDLRGHGRSGRRVGHASSFNVLVKDLLQVAAWIKHNEGGKPPVILGHGIGALITLEFAKHHAQFCKATILSAPVLELAAKVSWATRTFLKIMAEVSPTMRLPKSMNPRFAKDLRQGNAEAGLSVAEQARKSFFPRLTASFAHELLQVTSRAKETFIEYPGAVLILCPENDSVCTYSQIKRAAALHRENNVSIKDIAGCSHQVFTEDEHSRRAAFDLILPWLERTLDG
jgi:alpha-beta hydrolase superfamily lysophospholipase